MIHWTLGKIFQPQAAEQPKPMVWEPAFHNVSPHSSHAALVRLGMSKLPIELQDKYASAGHKVYITRRIQDAASFLPHTRDHLRDDKGWDLAKALKDADHCHGSFFKFDNHIVIPKKVVENRFSSKVKAQADYFVAHEIGHLFSNTENNGYPVSTEPEFIELGMEDLRRATSDAIIHKTFNGANIIIALGNGDGLNALEELFADLFAEAITGRKDMSLLAPNTARWVRNKIETSIEMHRAAFITSHLAKNDSTNIPA